jgi:hypothetical protein
MAFQVIDNPLAGGDKNNFIGDAATAEVLFNQSGVAGVIFDKQYAYWLHFLSSFAQFNGSDSPPVPHMAGNNKVRRRRRISFSGSSHESRGRFRGYPQCE